MDPSHLIFLGHMYPFSKIRELLLIIFKSLQVENPTITYTQPRVRIRVLNVLRMRKKEFLLVREGYCYLST